MSQVPTDWSFGEAFDDGYESEEAPPPPPPPAKKAGRTAVRSTAEVARERYENAQAMLSASSFVTSALNALAASASGDLKKIESRKPRTPKPAPVDIPASQPPPSQAAVACEEAVAPKHKRVRPAAPQVPVSEGGGGSAAGGHAVHFHNKSSFAKRG